MRPDLRKHIKTKKLQNGMVDYPGRFDDPNYAEKQEWLKKRGYPTDADRDNKNIKKMDPKVFEAGKVLFMADNHGKYLKEPLKIGFTEPFPEDGHTDIMTVQTKCKGYDVIFNVRFGKVTFGDGKHHCDAITTDRVDIGHNLPLGGFGSHCYADEAAVMEKAVTDMAKKHGVLICQKVCSWPFAKAIVDKVTESHVKHFVPAVPSEEHSVLVSKLTGK